MKTLVLGSGGREHALAWRMAQDEGVTQVFLHPGNAGTAKSGIASLGDVSIDNRHALAERASQLGIQLIVIGPETLLAKGYADFFRQTGFQVVGPGVSGARLETSKAFAKRFLHAGAIPTARSTETESAETVWKAVGDRYPVVLKLDGLAAGKGVVVAQRKQDVEDFLDRVWGRKEFGDSDHAVVVEEFIEGRELSYIGLCDGSAFVALSSASDYKRLLDADKGPNTGGMGCISPSPVYSKTLEERIEKEIVIPTLQQLKAEHMEYRGALYFGLMIAPDGSPYVLEFNARFGYSETQALMLRLEGNFTSVLLATAQGKLAEVPPLHWSPSTSLYVVAAAEGYPSSPRTGDRIEGLDSVNPHTQIFYSGVGALSPGLSVQGGRVLGLGATGPDVEHVRERVYGALSQVRWPGMQYRKDIGY